MGAGSSDQFFGTPAAAFGLLPLERASDVGEVLLAGARARTVAQALDGMGLAAVLLDRVGRVLHVGDRAAGLFGASLRVEADHLIASDPEGNAAIASVLNGVLNGEPTRAAAGADPVTCIHGAVPLAITAVSFGDASPFQLLRAIVLLGPDEAALRSRLALLDL